MSDLSSHNPFSREEILIESEEKEDKREEAGLPGEEESATPESQASISEAKQEENITEQTEKIDHEQVAKENYDRYLRTMADFENYKRRTQKEQSDLLKFGNERTLKEMLPIIDNLERAIEHSKETGDFQKMIEGLDMIRKQFLSALEKFEVRQIESIDAPFDPFQHQAVGQSPIAEGSGVKENQVVAETQKGYKVNDRVLRPSLVIVAKAAVPPQPDETEVKSQTDNSNEISNGTEEGND